MLPAAAIPITTEPNVERWPEFDGYRIDALVHRGERANIYRGTRKADRVPVVLKVFQGSTLTAANCAACRHEFELLRGLHSEGIVQAHDIRQEPTALALIVEDIGGEALQEIIKTRNAALDLGEKLKLALKLVAAIRDVHAANVIHKDINPNNIVVNLETGTVKLIDFGMARRLTREQPDETIPTSLLGTLAYIAPEQTGRMNRAVDYRSDYYALGATLYELFTGEVPFPGTDTLELIHAHIARMPKPPHEISSDVPEALSRIILKLLAKTAEERYQSTWSLAADLERCLSDWQARGTVELFSIDQLRIRDRFQPPQTIYGRDPDMRALHAAFERAAAGKPEVVFVTGPLGIGKSALVHEMYQSVSMKHGFFVSGRFDPLQRHLPYSALASALRELARQLLTNDEARIAVWREALGKALGSEASMLMDLVPELELVLGRKPAPSTPSARDAQARLFAITRRFFRVVCRPEHPVVLFLDDLRHADAASFALLQRILIDPELTSCLFIGAYRSNEVDETSAVARWRELLAKSRVAQTELALAPIEYGNVARLIGDTIGLEPTAVDELARVILAKTGGNPQFVAEFLKSLHAKNLLWFDNKARSWCWDTGQINAQAVTDNIGDLLADTLHELDPSLQKHLKLAAAIGRQFTAPVLAKVADEPLPVTLDALERAVTAALIVPEQDISKDTLTVEFSNFKFVHDRVRQALYAMMSDAEQQDVHYRVGLQLLAALDDNAPNQAIFEAAIQLNRGLAAAPPAERVKGAQLNLRAGRCAMAAAAYDAALDYFRSGIESIGDSGWSDEYALTLALHSEAAMAAPLCNRDDELDKFFEAVRGHGRSVLDKIPIYETRVAAAIRRTDTKTAMETGLEALRLLGVKMPRKANRLTRLYFETKAKFALFGRTPEQLADLPRMRDPERIAESRLLVRMGQLFYSSNRPMALLTLYRFVYLCAKYGNSDAAPTMYTNYGLTLCAEKNFDLGYRYGRLALTLLDKLDAKDQRPWVTNMVNGFLEQWRNHARDSLPILQQNHRDAMAIGDIRSAGVALALHGYLSFHVGEPLTLLHETLTSHIGILSKTLKDKHNAGIMDLYEHATAYLTGSKNADNYFALTDTASERSRAAEKQRAYTFHFFRGFFAIHFGDHEAAYRSMQEMSQHVHTITGILRFGDLYDGLARLLAHPKLSPSEQQTNRHTIERIRNRLKRFAKESPDNYLHRWRLLEAEWCRFMGQTVAAMEQYDEAIDAARASGHVHEEALANELAARFYLAAGKDKVAQAYMAEARALYLRWGANKKVRWLDETLPQLRAARETQRTVTIQNTSHSRTIATEGFDMPALMKALRTIAEKTVHSQILQETMQIVMQFAGAEKALLLLRGANDALQVEADADTSREQPELMKSIPLEESDRLCRAVANYAKRAKTSIVIQDAGAAQSVLPGLANDPYIRANGIKSILCIPITSGADSDAELIGVLYAENNRSSYAFTEQRVETLELICLSLAGRLELSRKAITDSLTGLYNRGYFQGTLTKECSSARRKERSLSLVLVDIDHFKKVNDEWGHQVGDDVLKHVAKMLKTGCRESDIIARYGGEEMALILPETKMEAAMEVAERIRQSLAEQPYTADGTHVPVTASFGVATLDAEHESADELIKAADDALYRSKENGRNRVTAANEN